MTKEKKARNGARCHNGGWCEECPYYVKNEMLDPRIDPDYGANAMKQLTGCRDELIADLSAIIGE